jgi:hypothetical protein
VFDLRNILRAMVFAKDEEPFSKTILKINQALVAQND